MYRNAIIAAIRTGCAVLGPAVLAAVAAFLFRFGINIEIGSEQGLALAAGLYALAVAGYNAAVNFLTNRVWPGFGWLLGVNQPPSYITAAAQDFIEQEWPHGENFDPLTLDSTAVSTARNHSQGI